MTGPRYQPGDDVCVCMAISKVVRIITRADSDFAHYNIRLLGGDMIHDVREPDIRPHVANDEGEAP